MHTKNRYFNRANQTLTTIRKVCVCVCVCVYVYGVCKEYF
jgi:hypothetical protein